jgi:N-formylglutamate amidohydrolase
MTQGFPIIKYSSSKTPTPILISIPHYGTEALPHITRADYTESWFETFAYGFADTFAGELYADLHTHGATILATPFSRIFVDVNRRRNDFAGRVAHQFEFRRPPGRRRPRCRRNRSNCF